MFKILADRAKTDTDKHVLETRRSIAEPVGAQAMETAAGYVPSRLGVERAITVARSRREKPRMPHQGH